MLERTAPRASATPASAAAPAHPSILLGVFWALFTVLVWVAWPVFTRLSVSRAVNPQDLVALRYAIGGLILLPVLIRQTRIMPAHGWREGIVLAFC